MGVLRSWRDRVGVAANRGRSSGRVRERERREERCSRERPLWAAARGAAKSAALRSGGGGARARAAADPAVREDSAWNDRGTFSIPLPRLVSLDTTIPSRLQLISLPFASPRALRMARTQVCRHRHQPGWSPSPQAPSICPGYAVEAQLHGRVSPGVARHHLLFVLFALGFRADLDLRGGCCG